MNSSVDVLLPVREPAEFLEQTLLSILDQTYAASHLIVVLDGPCEAEEVMVRSLVPGACVVRHWDHPGLGALLNTGLQLSTAKYISRIDQDDVMQPDRLRRQTTYLDEHPDVVAVGSAIALIDHRGDFLGVRESPGSSSDVLRRLRWRNALAHPATTFRREAIVKAGGYSAHAAGLEDYVLWLSLAQSGKLACLHDSLTEYRIHDTQSTSGIRFPSMSLGTLGQARQQLAQAEGASLQVAKFRHWTWLLAQAMKGRISLGQLIWQGRAAR